MTHSPDLGAENQQKNRQTNRRRSAPTGARLVWHTVQKSAPIFGADIRRRNLDCVSSALGIISQQKLSLNKYFSAKQTNHNNHI